MTGTNRTINKVSDKTENAQCRVDRDLHTEVVERAREEGVSAAYYYRRWIMTGHKKDFRGKK